MAEEASSSSKGKKKDTSQRYVVPHQLPHGLSAGQPLAAGKKTDTPQRSVVPHQLPHGLSAGQPLAAGKRQTLLRTDTSQQSVAPHQLPHGLSTGQPLPAGEFNLTTPFLSASKFMTRGKPRSTSRPRAPSQPFSSYQGQPLVANQLLSNYQAIRGYAPPSNSVEIPHQPYSKPEVPRSNAKSDFTIGPPVSADTNNEWNTLTIKQGKEKSRPFPTIKVLAGIRLGVTPFPNFERPTREECYRVKQLLEQEHGHIVVPEMPDMPSATIAGCGNVPFVLEALIRTVISQNTTMAQANTAIVNVVQKFGLLNEGPCAGSIDWNKVRLSHPQLLIDAIRPAGTQIKKSKHIRSILQDVWKENKEQRLKLESWDSKDKLMVKVEKVHKSSMVEFQNASMMTNVGVNALSNWPETLTLEYLHESTTAEAFERLNQFDGVGVKTAACVLLFCMQKPVFAVDTHVWRFCRWLGWVPTLKVSANNTFAHCDVRVPDELKYALHQLMILHGQTCKRCNARKICTPNDPRCVLEHLLSRHRSRDGVEKRANVEIEEFEEDDEEEVQFMGSTIQNVMPKKRKVSNTNNDTAIIPKYPKLLPERPWPQTYPRTTKDNEEDEASRRLPAAPFASNTDEHDNNDIGYENIPHVFDPITNKANRGGNEDKQDEDMDEEEGQQDDSDVGDERMQQDEGEAAEEEQEDETDEHLEENRWPIETDNEADSDFESDGSSSDDDEEYGRASRKFNTDPHELDE